MDTKKWLLELDTQEMYPLGNVIFSSCILCNLRCIRHLLKDGNVVVKVMVLTFHADLCRIAEIERGDQKGRWEWLRP
jgi:hypothetical protein